MSSLTSGLQTTERDDTFSDLVYKVQKLPESMLPYVWDFKSLEKAEEGKYIQKML